MKAIPLRKLTKKQNKTVLFPTMACTNLTLQRRSQAGSNLIRKRSWKPECKTVQDNNCIRVFGLRKNTSQSQIVLVCKTISAHSMKKSIYLPIYLYISIYGTPRKTGKINLNSKTKTDGCWKNSSRLLFIHPSIFSLVSKFRVMRGL